MVTIAYIHDGTSLYDELFINSLVRNHRVFFLTFNSKPRYKLGKTRWVMMREPWTPFSSREWMEGLRMYLFSLLRALLLQLYLRRLRPRLIIGCMATKYGFYSALTGFKPSVLIVWGSDVLLAPKRFFFLRFMASYAVRKASVVVVDSVVQEKAVLELGCDPERVLRFPWFDLENLRSRVSRGEVRAGLGWQNNTIVISTRSHEPVYGLVHLIEAIPRVLEREPSVRFQIVGGGSLTDRLKQRVDELRIGDYVRFLGRVSHEDVVAYVNAADINVSTSFSDGTSASLLEAMALGVASVVTDIPGNREWIKDGESGYLVPVADSEKLAERVIDLTREAGLRKVFAENARRTVQARVNWAKNMAVLDKLIRKLTVEASEREKR